MHSYTGPGACVGVARDLGLAVQDMVPGTQMESGGIPIQYAEGAEMWMEVVAGVVRALAGLIFQEKVSGPGSDVLFLITT